MVATMLSETESPAPGSLKELRWGREERRVDGGVRNENKLVIRVEGCPPTDCPCLGRCVCLAGAIHPIKRQLINLISPRGRQVERERVPVTLIPGSLGWHTTH